MYRSLFFAVFHDLEILVPVARYITLTQYSFTTSNTSPQTLVMFYNRINGCKLQNTPTRCLTTNLKSCKSVIHEQKHKNPNKTSLLKCLKMLLGPENPTNISVK